LDRSAAAAIIGVFIVRVRCCCLGEFYPFARIKHKSLFISLLFSPPSIRITANNNNNNDADDGDNAVNILLNEQTSSPGRRTRFLLGPAMVSVMRKPQNIFRMSRSIGERRNYWKSNKSLAGFL